MSRSMMDIEDELTRLWGLVGELSEQLSNNRALVTQLKSRSENVKGQAVHVGSGFPLRRFNLDISNEEFHSSLEEFSAHLVLENQQLQHENKQLNALLKEYEQTLETVMSKFRGVAHTSQAHDLSLHSYYTSLLQTLQTAHSSAQLHDSTSLSLLLNRLSTLLRTTLRSLGGEEPDGDGVVGELEDGLSKLLILTDNASVSASAAASGSGISSAEGSLSPKFPAKQKTKAPRGQFGFTPGSSGGYSGTDGVSDWAIEREYEITRLEEENKALRELLLIANDTNLPLPLPEPSTDTLSSTEGEDGQGTRSRKSSLTVEELEKGAVVEADRKRVAEELRIGMDQYGDQTSSSNTTAQATPQSQRPLMNESVLGFQAGPPPEEAVVDDTDPDAQNELGRES